MQFTARGNFKGGPATNNVANPGPAGAISVNFTLGGNPTPTPTPTPTPMPTPTPTPMVSVAPSSATLQVGGTQQFQATVSNSANTQVNWAVNGITGGNATVGTINASGLYTAPASLPFMGVATITATSTTNSN